MLPGVLFAKMDMSIRCVIQPHSLIEHHCRNLSSPCKTYHKSWKVGAEWPGLPN